MESLATVEDYRAFIGSLPEDIPRVEHLMRLASSAIREHSGQQVTSGPVSETRRPHDGAVYLTQRPVTSITSVVVDGTPLDPTEYEWTPGGRGRHAAMVPVRSGHLGYWGSHQRVHVEYVAGWTEIPGQLIGLVVAGVRAIVNAEGGPQVIQESAGPFQVSFAGGAAIDMHLTPSAVRTVDKLLAAPPIPSIRAVKDY